MNGYKLKARQFDTHGIMTKIKDGLISKEELVKRLKLYSKSKSAKTFEEALQIALDKYKDIIKSLEGLKDQ